MEVQRRADAEDPRGQFLFDDVGVVHAFIALALAIVWVRAGKDRWRVYACSAAIVAVTTRGTRLGRYLTAEFGPPTIQVGDMLAWRRPAGSGAWHLWPSAHPHARLVASGHR